MRQKLIRLLVVAVCAIGLVWVVGRIGPRRVLDVALEADPLWLGLSIVPVLGRFLIWGYKWHRMLARRAAVPYGFGLRLLVAGSFVNLTTPTAKLAGGVVRGAFLNRRFGWGLATSYGHAMADQVTNVLGNVLLYGLLAVAAGVVLGPADPGLLLFVSGAIVLVGLCAGALLRPWVLRRIRSSGAWMRLIPSRFRGEATEETPVRILGPLLGSRLSWFTADLLWAAVAFGSLCLANAMVLRSLGAETPLLLVAIAVVLGYFAGVLVGMGGIGVTEAALTGLYVRFGLPLELATAGALLHRATFYTVVLGWGGYSLWREGTQNVE